MHMCGGGFALLKFILGRDVSFYDSIKTAFYYWSPGNRYFAVLAGCYIVTPFLYVIIQDIAMEKYLIFLGIIFCFIVPPFCDLDFVKTFIPGWVSSIFKWIDYQEVYIPVGSVLLFVLGHYLGKNSFHFSKLNAIIFIVVSGTFWISMTIGIGVNPERKNLLNILRYGRYYGSYVSPVITLYSCSVFVFFKVMFENLHLSDKFEKIINHLGRNSVIIYLLHNIVINIIRPKIPVFWCPSFIIETICDVTLYFIIAFVLSLGLERIPLLRKII